MKYFRSLIRQQQGMTLIELLISVFMTALIAGAAMEFYVSQHDSWLTQENVSEMQQSLRVSANELSVRLRNAGGALPEGLAGVWGGDANPDTITVRYSRSASGLNVGGPTSKNQAVPIHVDRHSNFDGWAVGDHVYIYRPPAGPGEFFTITKLSYNNGNGWMEVGHQGQDLINDPLPGDVIIKLEEARFWIDNSSDSLHPTLMRAINGVTEIYAEEISDLQCTFTLTDSTVVDAPAVGDTVVAVDFNLVSQTVLRNLSVAGDAGMLTRQAGSRIFLRNRPGVG